MSVNSSLYAHAGDSMFYIGERPFGPVSLTITTTHMVAVSDDGQRRDTALSEIFQASAAATFDGRRRGFQRWSKTVLIVTGLFGGPTSTYNYRGRYLNYIVNLGSGSFGATLGPLAAKRPPRWWSRAITATFEGYGHARRLDILAAESFGVISDLESCRSWSGVIASQRAQRAVKARLRSAEPPIR